MKAFSRSETSQGCGASIYLKRAVAMRLEQTSRRRNEGTNVSEAREGSRALVSSRQCSHHCQYLRPANTAWVATGKCTVRNGERWSARTRKGCAPQTHYCWRL